MQQQEIPKKNNVPSHILHLRVIVTALGEVSQPPWWRTQYLSETGLRFPTGCACWISRARKGRAISTRLQEGGYVKALPGHYARFKVNHVAIQNAEAPTPPLSPFLISFRLLKEEDKEAALLEILRNPNDPRYFVVSPQSFSLVPNTPFAYWVSERVALLQEPAEGPHLKDIATKSGREASRLRDRWQDMRTFLGELQDFRQELLRVAGLPYKPDLNDGVIIDAAPLHRLFRHRQWAQETKACWEKLERGEYDWAHLAYTIWLQRVREICRQDRSIAIAHGLEGLYEAPQPKAEGKGKRKGRGVAARA